MVTTEEHGKMVLDSLIAVLMGKVSDEFVDSTTAAFKLIPFQNTAINRAGIAELIEQQNNFLHCTTTTSVVDMGTGNEWFTAKEDGKELKQAEGSIRIWTMGART